MREEVERLVGAGMAAAEEMMVVEAVLAEVAEWREVEPMAWVKGAGATGEVAMAKVATACSTCHASR